MGKNGSNPLIMASRWGHLKGQSYVPFMMNPSSGQASWPVIGFIVSHVNTQLIISQNNVKEKMEKF